MDGTPGTLWASGLELPDCIPGSAAGLPLVVSVLGPFGMIGPNGIAGGGHCSKS